MNRHRTLTAALLLAGTVTLTGCSGTSTPSTAQTAPTTESSSASPTSRVLGPTAASTPVKVPAGSHLSPTDFADASASTPGTVLLDVRTPAEFAAGHLPGAVNSDVESPEFATTMADRDKSASYAVYCHSGNRSAVALQQLGDLGFGDAYDLAGGIAAWSAAGGKVVTGP